MPILVMITDRCRQDCVTHGFLSEIEKFRDKIEREQAFDSLERFLPYPCFKKSFGREKRLVVTEHVIQEAGEGQERITILAFIRLLIRGGSEYAQAFLNDALGYAQGHMPSQDELNALVVERQSSLPEALPSPTEAEMSFLFAGFGSLQQEAMVYESEVWVEAFRNDGPFRERLAIYRILAERIALEETGTNQVIEDQANRIGIVFRKVQADLFLLQPIIIPDSPCAEIRCLLDEMDDLTFLTKAKRMARRSYPNLILNDMDLWFGIQRNAEANLSLSPEEMEILDAIRTNQIQFPLFINGRPGSGKSTLLQYLFADLLYYHLTAEPDNCPQEHPLFITYSPNLLSRSRAVVRSILQCDAQRALESGRIEDGRIQPMVEKAFVSMRTLLVDLLPASQRACFGSSGLVDFARFRDAWQAHAQQRPELHVRELKPELAWHVIRTYIKGMASSLGEEGFCTPEDYIELPRDRRTVREETYRLVWESAFRWYQGWLADNSFWDDQDLAIAALHGDGSRLGTTQYSAVFCDEAQDFTALELRLIYHLSLFSRRSLTAQALTRVPIAFAGDPFQTLNPTGFNWDQVKNHFHEHILTNLQGSRITSLQMSFRELAFNYRAMGSLVKFNNLLQLTRGTLFAHRSLSPQEAWSIRETEAPRFFFSQSPECRLTDQAANLVIVVPCQEGQELAFAREDELLAQVVVDGTLRAAVLSPMAAKGLEFSRVVLYKFGEYIIRSQGQDLNTLLDSRDLLQKDPERSLPLEYAFNALYVGASRPQKRLFVVDSENGYRGFWAKFEDKAFLEHLITEYNSSAWRLEHLVVLQPGNAQHWEDEKDDPRQLADSFRQKALDERSAFFMRQASNYYTTAGQHPLAKECEAHALRFEGNYAASGELFRTLFKYPEAFESFWEAKMFSDAAVLAKDYQTLRRSLEGRFVALREDWLRSASNRLVLTEQFLADLHQEVEKETSARFREDAWLEAYRILESWFFYEQNAEPFQDPSERDCLIRMAVELEGLSEHGIPVLRNPSDRGYLRYLAGSMEEARRLLSAQGVTVGSGEGNRPWVLRVFRETTTYPENLRVLLNAKDFRAMVDAWQANLDKQLDQASQGWLFEALVVNGNEPEGNALLLTFLKSVKNVALARRAADVSRNRSWSQDHRKLVLDCWISLQMQASNRPKPNTEEASALIRVLHAGPEEQEALLRILTTDPSFEEESLGAKQGIWDQYIRPICPSVKSPGILDLDLLPKIISRFAKPQEALNYLLSLTEKSQADERVRIWARKVWLLGQSNFIKDTRDKPTRQVRQRDLETRSRIWGLSVEQVRKEFNNKSIESGTSETAANQDDDSKASVQTAENREQLLPLNATLENVNTGVAPEFTLNMTMRLGELTFESTIRHKVLKVDFIETESQVRATIDLRKKGVQGDPELAIINADDSFHISDWGLIIRFPEEGRMAIHHKAGASLFHFGIPV